MKNFHPKIAIFSLAVFFVVLLIMCNSYLREIEYRRVEAFQSFQILMVSVDGEYENFDQIAEKYTGMNSKKWSKLIYGFAPFAPEIKYVKGIQLRESKAYPVSLFRSDYLEISYPDLKLKWGLNKVEPNTTAGQIN